MSPDQSLKKHKETKVKEIIYPIDPIYKSTFLPNLSIKNIPKRVKIKLVIPRPIVPRDPACSSRPATAKILFA